MAHWVHTLIIAIIGTGHVSLRLVNARARERAGLPPPVKVKRPVLGLTLLLLIELLLIYVFYTGYSHGFSADGRISLLLVVNTAAIVVITFRLLLRRFLTGSWRTQNG
jgi:hypothetical protein